MKKSSNIKYFVSEGVKTYTVNGLMSIASTVIVIASLIVFGIYLLFSININHIAQQLQSECEIQVWIDDSVAYGSSAMQKLENSIKNIDNVNSVEFFSKDNALADYKNKLGEDSDYLEGLEDDNPLRNSFKVTLKNISLAEDAAKSIKKFDGVADVSDNQSSINRLLNATKIIKHISFWFMIFLSAIAVFIISNTIKITLFARRRDINIMKYLGADNSFISWPFIIEGIIIGLIGALISLIIVILAYGYFVSMDVTFFGTIKFCTVSEVILPLLGWFAGIGVLLGAFGSAISIRRHLRV
ncbi:MAG: permease-like cell division protein FtsX [Clostridia bacterium]|nr:permease-like cell division protein FtsX [Clostridia bacterium]